MYYIHIYKYIIEQQISTVFTNAILVKSKFHQRTDVECGMFSLSCAKHESLDEILYEIMYEVGNLILQYQSAHRNITISPVIGQQLIVEIHFRKYTKGLLDARLKGNTTRTDIYQNLLKQRSNSFYLFQRLNDMLGRRSKKNTCVVNKSKYCKIIFIYDIEDYLKMANGGYTRIRNHI